MGSIKQEQISMQKYDEVEYANALTHGLGFLLSLLATYFLVHKGLAIGTSRTFWGLTIFGLSLCFLYLASTVYHSMPFEPSRGRVIWQRVDHIAIYFLIAGTHTPFLLQFMEGNTALFYLGVIWGMVLIGTIYKLFFFERWAWFSVVFYVIMGWSGLVTIPQMSDTLSDASVYWVLIGGLFYTAGVFFYVRTQMKWHHVIWHLFVLAGSAGHFVAVWLT